MVVALLQVQLCAGPVISNLFSVAGLTIVPSLLVSIDGTIRGVSLSTGLVKRDVKHISIDMARCSSGDVNRLILFSGIVAISGMVSQ